MRTLDYIVLIAAGIFAIKFVLPLFKQAVSYAADTTPDVLNCDGPITISKFDKDWVDRLPLPARTKAIKKLLKERKDQCAHVRARLTGEDMNIFAPDPTYPVIDPHAKPNFGSDGIRLSHDPNNPGLWSEYARAYAGEAQDAKEQAILKKLLADLNRRTYGKPAQAQIEAAKKQARAMAISDQMAAHEAMNNVRMMQAAHSQDEMLGLAKTNPYVYDANDEPFLRRKRMDFMYTDCKSECAKCHIRSPGQGKSCEICQDACEGYQDERRNAVRALKKSDVQGQHVAKASVNHIIQNSLGSLSDYLGYRVNQMFGVAPPITGMPVAPPVLAYAATDDEVATMKQRPTAKSTGAGAGAVSQSAWACITHRDRLQVINNNATVTGTVIAAGDGGPHYAPDGDLVFAFKPDPPYANMVNEVNKSNKKYAGGLWMEGVCQKANKAKEPRHQGDCKCSPPKFAQPKNGDRLKITGAHVKDVGEEGHNEIHPIYTMEKIA